MMYLKKSRNIKKYKETAKFVKAIINQRPK